MGPDARIFVFWMWILSQLFNDNNKNFKFHSWAGFPVTPAGGSILILFSFPSSLFYDFHPLLWPLAGWRGRKGRKCLYNLEFRDALASALPMKQVVSSLRYFCGFFKDLLVSGDLFPVTQDSFLSLQVSDGASKLWASESGEAFSLGIQADPRPAFSFEWLSLVLRKHSRLPWVTWGNSTWVQTGLTGALFVLLRFRAHAECEAFTPGSVLKPEGSKNARKQKRL